MKNITNNRQRKNTLATITDAAMEQSKKIFEIEKALVNEKDQDKIKLLQDLRTILMFDVRTLNRLIKKYL